MMRAGRYGEAIGPLKRAANLGESGPEVWLELSLAFSERNRWLAALGAALEAKDAGAREEPLALLFRRIDERLGEPLGQWRKFVGGG